MTRRPIRVRLHGGPAELAQRDHTVASLDEPVKVPFGAGYEHFAYAGPAGEAESGDRDEAVEYRWSHRTKVAE